MDGKKDVAAPSPHSCDPSRGNLRVNGVRIDPLDPPAYMARLDQFLACGRSHIVHFFAAHATVEARLDSRYRELLDRGDLNLPDGAPVAWALALQGVRTKRLSGTEGTLALVDWGLGRGLRHYFYGSTPEVLSRLRANLVGMYPGVRITGVESPPFRPVSDEELSESVRRMRDVQADVVWVGLGAPRQDVLAERLRALEAAPLILCIGAAFDFIAGTKRRAPLWMQQSGLEWVHRLASEPRRLWRRYLIGNSIFVAGVVLDQIRRPSR